MHASDKGLKENKDGYQQYYLPEQSPAHHIYLLF